MIKNSFFQKVFLTMFWGFFAAVVMQFYIKMIWQANEDINGDAATKALYSNAKQTVHPAR